MPRRLSSLLLALHCVAACQCLEPVDDRGLRPTDGGAQVGAGDAGSADAGGVDAGECGAGAGCTGLPSARCGFSTLDAPRSCVDGVCVFDCAGPRSCRLPFSAGCLTCDGGVGTCGPTGSLCGSAALTNGGRLSRRCPSTVEALGTFSLARAQGATCNFVLRVDGGVFAELDFRGDDLQATATVTDEPGVRCPVWGLATALERVELGCRRCVYQLEWP